MKKIHLFSVLTGLLLGATSCASSKLDKSTVPNVDLTRYMGKWYEIGRFDVAFEKGLVGTTANYTLNSDGTVEVINAGYKESLTGEATSAEGKARVRKSGKPGELEVAFFLNFYADYNILELDTVGYSYSVVGSSSDKYLWILSRTPKMDTDVLNGLLQKIAARGYNTSKILWVDQPNE